MRKTESIQEDLARALLNINKLLKADFMKTIGFFGTAKNTGKTTTVISLINSTLMKDCKVGVTSIGYDGEDFDNITKLPKPKYFMPQGTVIATAENTLKGNHKDCQVFKTTNVNSALGRILIIRINKPGYYILAGPTSTNYLNSILKEFEKLGMDYVFIDGALNRIAPFSITDGLIMATGAAKTTNIPVLVQETKAMCDLFKIPSANCQMPEYITLETGNDRLKLPLKSLLTKEDLDVLLNIISSENISRLYIPGIITMPLLIMLRDAIKKPLELIFSDVTKLILAGDIKEVTRFFQNSENVLQHRIFRPIKLLGITVSPYYNCYRHEFGDYKAAYVDKDILLEKIRKAVELPVVNTLEDDLELLKMTGECCEDYKM